MGYDDWGYGAVYPWDRPNSTVKYNADVHAKMAMDISGPAGLTQGPDRHCSQRPVPSAH